MEAQQSDNITIDISDETLATTHAYVFNTDANITATFNSIERVIASGNGDDTINVNGDRNTTLAVGEDGQLIITNGDNATQAENVAFIELDDDTVAIADNEADALTLKLYQGVLGRSAAAGADYWPDLEPQTDVEIAARFLDSAEFAKEHRPDEDLSNE